jgi:hypothetical protein
MLMKKIILYGILSYSFIYAFTQNEVINSVGIKPGIINSIHYDPSFNFKIYDNIKLNPVYLHYSRASDNSVFKINFYYLKNNLSPTISDAAVISDEIVFQSGNIETGYMRKILATGEMFEMLAGASIRSFGYLSERTLNKDYPTLRNVNQVSYEFTFLSFNPSVQARYNFNSTTLLSFILDVPVIALNSKNYNDRISPLLQDVWGVSFSKYGGFNSYLSFCKKFNWITLEAFGELNYNLYKVPNKKEILIGNVGIGLYYEW